MAKTIVLKGHFVRKEQVASAAITPGHLVQVHASGGAPRLRPHNDAGGNAQRAFALENDLVGGGINDAYVVGATVQYGVFAPGSEVYAWLAAGENAALGAALESAGDGTLQVHTPVNTDATDVNIPAAPIVAYAAEAVDNSGSTQPVRIKVEVA